jgi:hypothetical protein
VPDQNLRRWKIRFPPLTLPKGDARRTNGKMRSMRATKTVKA